MALYGATFENFAGLDLSDAANESAGAIDMLNAELDVRGRVRSRDGFTKFTTSAAPSPFLGITPLPTVVAAGHIIGPLVNGKVQVANATTGALVSITAAATLVTSFNFVQFAVGGTVAGYGPSGQAGGLLKWSGAAFSDVGGGWNAGKYVNITPVDKRLMVLCRTFVPGTEPDSTVSWSDPGNPELFTTGNNLQLDPGDGELLRGVCNFANQTFVFKETKFYVFTQTTTDSAGNPIFNYRTVNTGIGAHPIALNACCCAAPDGVYFFARDGIYKTTGGAPIKVSTAIDPLFGVGGPVPPYFQGQPVSYASASRAFMQFFKNRIYITYDGTGGSRGMLVYDIPTQQWMYSNVAANGLCANPISGALTFAYQGTTSPTNTDDLGTFSTSATTDAGTAITWRYRSGYISFDYAGRTIKRGYQGVEKTIREAIVDGMGTVNFRLAKQWVQPGALPSVASLALGTSPQVAQARDRRAVRGRMFSYELGGTAPGTVEKLVLNLRDIHEPGLQQSGN